MNRHRLGRTRRERRQLAKFRVFGETVRDLIFGFLIFAGEAATSTVLCAEATPISNTESPNADTANRSEKLKVATDSLDNWRRIVNYDFQFNLSALSVVS